MARSPHPLDRAGFEHLGPMDVRSIEANDITAAYLRALGLVHEIKAAEGHRAAVTVALGAIRAATDALVELGAGGAAASALHMAAASLEERQAGAITCERGSIH